MDGSQLGLQLDIRELKKKWTAANRCSDWGMGSWEEKRTAGSSCSDWTASNFIMDETWTNLRCSHFYTLVNLK